MHEASKRRGGIRKRPPVDVDDDEDEAAAVLLRCPAQFDFIHISRVAAVHCRT